MQKMENQQQRFYIRTRLKLVLEAQTIFQELKLDWGEKALSHAKVRRWASASRRVEPMLKTMTNRT